MAECTANLLASFAEPSPPAGTARDRAQGLSEATGIAANEAITMLNRSRHHRNGCVSPVGHSLADVWSAAVEGRNRIKQIELFDTTE